MAVLATDPMISAAEEQATLLDIASRLAEDNPQLPAGLVLRCFARAVRTARACGVVPRDLGRVSEQIARSYLVSRECVVGS